MLSPDPCKSLAPPRVASREIPVDPGKSRDLFFDRGQRAQRVGFHGSNYLADDFQQEIAFFAEDTPLFLADLVHGLIQRLDEMEAVDDERHLGAVVRDRPDIGGAHVATGPGDTRFLSPAQPVVEEAIDGVTALA